MVIGLLGIDHTQMEMKNFEPIYLNNDGKHEFRKRLQNIPELSECVVLTTCNRLEFYFVAASLETGKKALIQALSTQKNIPYNQVESLLKLYPTDDCMMHLYSVAAGIQSMVFGENEILAQVKEAYENANIQKTTGPYLNKCFQSAIAVGKRVRSETEISRGAYSVSSIAIDAIRQLQLDYFEKSIAIIGMGTMGRRCLKKLDALGHPDIHISNRTDETSKKLASTHSATPLTFNTIFSKLKNVDIIISAMTLKAPEIFKHHLSDSKPQLIIDLGLPRNVDPELENEPQATLINVDGLKKIAEKNITRRKKELENAMVIIHDEISNFKQWLHYKQTHANTH